VLGKEVATRGFKVALPVLLILPIVCLSAIGAFAATESGYLSGPGASYTFAVNGPTSVTFYYPRGAVDFRATVVAPNGSVSNFDFDNDAVIRLTAPGLHNLTVYSNRGAGYWTASFGGGTYIPGDCSVSENRAWGYLNGAGDSCSFTLDTNGKELTVTFSYPKGTADFWVETIGQDGRTLVGNVDLDKGEILVLTGGGSFYITIYSNGGAGNWLCSW
jgi:hypothetical protein